MTKHYIRLTNRSRDILALGASGPLVGLGMGKGSRPSVHRSDYSEARNSPARLPALVGGLSSGVEAIGVLLQAGPTSLCFPAALRAGDSRAPVVRCPVTWNNLAHVGSLRRTRVA